MKHLMLTTVLATATAFGAMAQTASNQTSGSDVSGRDGSQTAVPAFLASSFTGKTLYTLDSDEARMLSGQQRAGQGDTTRTGNGMSLAERDRMRWTSSDTFLAERDGWQDVGEIEDIVMTMEGEIRGVLLDVGGFLGFGTHTVMVDIQDLHFVTEDGSPEDIDDFFVVIAMSQEQLENLQEWDADRLDAGFEVRSYRQQDLSTNASGAAGQTERSDMGRDSGNAVFGDKYTMLQGADRTMDRLIGADVYDARGEHIGSVNDVVLGNQNRISDVLVDVGGFLGVGSHTVKLPINDAQIGWSDSDNGARVQVSMTGSQLEDMPAHGG